MNKIIRIGTRESQLAVWQATTVKQLLEQHGYAADLVYIRSEGDTDLRTPLYEMGVQGIFTKALDIALLNNEIDIAVHSMKDVPTVMAKGVVQAAVLPRATYRDIIVPKSGATWEGSRGDMAQTIATSSIRRKAQWLHRYPNDTIENLRGNVNTRLKKLEESDWSGAIFAAAGLERIGLRPANAIDLDWMLPAPAQGAIVVACKENDDYYLEACNNFNHALTALCVKAERDFLRALMGGCSTPISALASIHDDHLAFEGNVLSTDGKHKQSVSKRVAITQADNLGFEAAEEILKNGGDEIVKKFKEKI